MLCKYYNLSRSNIQEIKTIYCQKLQWSLNTLQDLKILFTVLEKSPFYIAPFRDSYHVKQPS